MMGLFDRLSKSKSEPAEETETTPQAESQPVPSQAGDSAAQAAGTPAAAAAEDQPVEGGERQGGVFSRFRKGLQKTAQLLQTDIRDLFKQEGRLVDDDFLRDLFAILVKTDMGAGPAGEIRDRIKSDFRGRVVSLQDLLDVVEQQIRELMAQPEDPIQFATEGPTVIMVVGVNGSGKTTSIAKLAYLFHSQGRRVVLGAGDTFRAAAVDQLKIWAERIGVEIVTGASKSDPASVAYSAVARTLETDADVCIIDTAGRLQTQTSLMQELSKIRTVIGKRLPAAPHEVLLVLDATAGQNGISQAKGFSEAADCTGIVLAKLDGTAKGGVVIPIRQQFDLPVKYIGVGEQPADLALFQADEFVQAMFADAGLADQPE